MRGAIWLGAAIWVGAALGRGRKKRRRRLLEEEKARIEHSLQTARRDSRLGYEWEQDYIYTPDHIEESLRSLN